jgi:hypothetical protein
MPQAVGSGFSTRMRARIRNGHHELKPGLRQMSSCAARSDRILFGSEHGKKVVDTHQFEGPGGEW